MIRGIGKMANLMRARNKLLKNGFLPKEQTVDFEIWIDATSNGTDIEFGIESETQIHGSFKVHGRRPDEPQHDLWYSTWTKNLKEAINLSRA